MKKLNICMIADDYIPPFTGVGIVARAFSEELVKRGHNISVITTRRKGQPDYEEINGVKIYRTFSIKVMDFYISLASKLTIRSILEKENPDIIHHHYQGVLSKRTIDIAKRLGIKNICTCHMIVEHIVQNSIILNLFSNRIKRLYVRFLNKCDFFTYPSRNVEHEIKTYGKITTPNIYLPNLINFINSKVDGTKSYNNDKFSILFVGRLNPEKNVSYLIRAFKILHDKHIDTELIIIGEGALKNDLIKLGSELGIENDINFLGYIENTKVSDYYASCGVFVLPSLVETQGMVAIEAMCFAKPVIVTDKIVSAKELVDNGLNGFIVNNKSVDDLADKLIQLKENPELRLNMGIKAKEKSKEFDTDAIIEKLEKIYVDLL